MNDPFESAVFDKLSQAIQRVRRVAFRDSTSFDKEVTKNLLNLTGLKDRDPRIRIASLEEGYDVRFSDERFALSITDLLKQDNPDCNLVFQDDLINFEPDEELIYKSKIPLWVICPVDQGKRVIIKRAW